MSSRYGALFATFTLVVIISSLTPAATADTCLMQSPAEFAGTGRSIAVDKTRSVCVNGSLAIARKELVFKDGPFPPWAVDPEELRPLILVDGSLDLSNAVFRLEIERNVPAHNGSLAVCLFEAKEVAFDQLHFVIGTTTNAGGCSPSEIEGRAVTRPTTGKAGMTRLVIELWCGSKRSGFNLLGLTYAVLACCALFGGCALVTALSFLILTRSETGARLLSWAEECSPFVTRVADWCRNEPTYRRPIRLSLDDSESDRDDSLLAK